MDQANSTQVAGTHYQTEYQTWDFIHDMKLGYFEGNVVKYVQRHPKKAGLTDLAKALHYTQKTRELYGHGRLPQHMVAEASRKGAAKSMPAFIDAAYRTIEKFCSVNAVLRPEASVIHAISTWRTSRDLERIESDIQDLMNQYQLPLA